MMNFASYIVTVNASSNDATTIRKAIEKQGLFVLELNGIAKMANSTYQCYGCFVQEGGRRA